MGRVKIEEIIPEEEQNWYLLVYPYAKNPILITLFALTIFVLYKIVQYARRRNVLDTQNLVVTGSKENLLPLLNRDFTLAQLREFNGTQEDGRILVAVYGNVYDVTCASRYYGVGGPYAPYAGTDASRNLATFSVVPNESTTYDDLSDLSDSQLASLREWDLQFREKYPFVGRLLRENEATPPAQTTPSATARQQQQQGGLMRRRVPAQS